MVEKFLSDKLGIQLPERKHYLSRRSKEILARLNRLEPEGSSDPKPTLADVERISDQYFHYNQNLKLH